MRYAITTEETPEHYKRATAAIVAVWFLLAVSCSLFGVFYSEQRPPLPLGLAATLPVVIFAIWYRRSPEFRQFVLAADPRFLTLAQTWRVAGLLFVILYYKGLLPGTFALPAGWGDFAIGVTAPLVAWSRSAGKLSNSVFAVWNGLGILDLVLAVTLGVLSSNTPAGILAGDVTTQLMGKFPLSLIPTFLVPLFLILHLISLAQVRAASNVNERDVHA